MNKITPIRANVLVLKQIFNLIPRGMINRLALETGIEAKSRTFSMVSHLSGMLFARLSHAMGLNDVCDWLRLKLGSFLGHRANAVRWHVYTALLVYVLLRFMAHLSAWGIALHDSLLSRARRYGRGLTYSHY